ncbi:venom carboxylesterase-6-like [Amphibalanus amphitrite]|uniref:venom carboxylesterase-6-like n=1 Tax=Amphibalanus amphitrite TaxID=1232801 RepID=UPI001C9040E1|nr:venom carboxylesterase-6-like [Amphibalanus amphitrite]
MLKAQLYATLLLVMGCSGFRYTPLGRPRIVRTQEGHIRGYTSKSASGKEYVAYKGIPYARPPVGELRFQPPQRHPGWRGVLDVKDHGSVCPQIDMTGNVTLVGDEDCLFVNVYSRKVRTWGSGVGRLPVMVFVHGGAFIRGSGNDRYYGPKYLMDEDIVLVTFNYRIGVFGFLTTYDAAAPGNYGLRDQVLLLQWVQDNIASFGGDPKAVTIFGQSAGAASVSLLVLSPLTKGLFHHAITQSGSALANFAASGRKVGFTDELAHKLGCYSTNTEAMIACLKKLPTQSLLATATPDKHLYQPRVDRDTDQPLLPEDPRALLEKGQFHHVPWMQGVTKEEGWFFVPIVADDKQLSAGFAAGNVIAWGLVSDILSSLDFNPLDCGADPMTEVHKVKKFYLGSEGHNTVSRLPIAQIISDRYFNAPMSAEGNLASRRSPVYRYVFEYKGPDRLFWENITRLNEFNTDPGHGDELLYVFSQAELPLTKPGTPNYNMTRSMVSLWTSFARTGKPSSESSAAPDWPIFTEQSQRHMKLDSNLTIGERLFEDRVEFWQTIAVNEPWRHPVKPPCPQGRLAGGDNNIPDDLNRAFYGTLITKFS